MASPKDTSSATVEPAESLSTVEIAEQAEQAVAKAEKEAKAPKPDTRPSILFCCPGSVLDITSGAALSLRTILSALVAQGFRAVALQASIFDSAQGGEHVMEAGKQQPDKPIWRTVINGVEHLIVKTGHPRRHMMTCQEEETYVNLFRAELMYRRPDMVFLWGGLVLERTIMREARDMGIPVVFYLVNPNYKDPTVFKDVSVIITDTEATKKLYQERFKLDLKVAGKFIDINEVKANVERRPDFVTFINPSFEKGVSVFMPLAKLMAKEAPEIKFLVVQSRGVWGEAMQKFGFKPEDFPNVKVIGHQRDMRPVYSSSRVVLLPSLWHESGARVIAEAHINGIPVLASNTGGSAELIGTGGKVFDLPEEVREKRLEAIITEAALRPWMEEIKRLWHDQAYYKAMCKKVEKEALQHDTARNAKRFIAAVAESVLKSKGIPLPKPGSKVPAAQAHPAKPTAQPVAKTAAKPAAKPVVKPASRSAKKKK
jgi:glycosyltransferase involved in cell wall biosynthesis